MGRIALTLALCLTLGACKTLTPPASTIPSAPVRLAVADGATAIDAAYNGTVAIYLSSYQQLTPANKARVKAGLASLLTCPAKAKSSAECTGYVASADAAARVGDATTLQAQVTTAWALMSQIRAVMGAK